MDPGEGFSDLPGSSSFQDIDGVPVMLAIDPRDTEGLRAWRDYGETWLERCKLDQQLHAARQRTQDQYRDKLQNSVEELVRAADVLAGATNLPTRLGEVRTADASIADLSGRVDRALDHAKAQMPDATNVPRVPAGTPPEAVERAIDPSQHEDFDFATPKGTPGWHRLVEANRYHRAAQAFVEQASTYQRERGALLTVAALGIDSADISYAAGDVRSGDSLLEAVGSVLDEVFTITGETIRGATSRGWSFLKGVLYGATGLPVQPTAGLENWFYLGEATGVVAGVAADAAVIVAGASMTGSGFAVTWGTGGVAGLVAIPALEAGVVTVGVGVAMAAGHYERFKEAREHIAYSHSASGTATKPALRKLTAGNMRANLARYTGRLPPKAHAHHVFPREFLKFFEKVGIKIHDPRFGSWWERSSHLSNAKQYNADWAEFFKTPARSVDEIVAFGRKMARDYGLEIYF